MDKQEWNDSKKKISVRLKLKRSVHLLIPLYVFVPHPAAVSVQPLYHSSTHHSLLLVASCSWLSYYCRCFLPLWKSQNVIRLFTNVVVFLDFGNPEKFSVPTVTFSWHQESSLKSMKPGQLRENRNEWKHRALFGGRLTEYV